MNDVLLKTAQENGDCLKIVPIKRLENLRNELARFQAEYDLNGFQKWIVNDLYSYEPPKTAYKIQSIIIVAMPHPAYAEVEFKYNGKCYTIFGLVSSEHDKTEHYIKTTLEQAGYHVEPAPRLPLKRLAVQCGLAEYGRNNITYVPGMGSHLSYAAYFTDMPPVEDSWREVCVAKQCNNCTMCLDKCPTEAIKKDSFLIDNSRCLSAMNESADAFPDWLPFSVHHTIYDCFRCQQNCPMNKNYNNKLDAPINFNEEETERIIKGPPYDKISRELKQKIKILALDKWPDGISRNLLLLFDLIDNGHIPSLR